MYVHCQNSTKPRMPAHVAGMNPTVKAKCRINDGIGVENPFRNSVNVSVMDTDCRHPPTSAPPKIATGLV